MGRWPDPLDRATVEAVGAGVAMRRYKDIQPDLGALGGNTSSSSVSRRFVAQTAKQIDAWMQRSLETVEVPIIIVDGLRLGEHMVLLALGIDRQSWRRSDAGAP